MVNMMEIVKMVKIKITMAGGKIYLVMEVILWKAPSCDESYLVINIILLLETPCPFVTFFTPI